MKKLSLILGMTLATSLAMAQESTSSTETTSTIEKSQVVPADKQVKDIDDEITNARLRASTGAKSKFSFRSSFGWSGGNLTDPLAKERPNYRNALGGADDTSLGGSVGMKYRITERDSLSASIGIAILTPFHNTASELADRTTIDNPSLGYDRLYKVGDVQMISSAGLTFITNSDVIRRRDMRGSLSLSQTALYSTSVGWDLGAAVTLAGYIYGNNDARADLAAYDLGLYPFAEYAFNDTFQFRTVFGYFNYAASRAKPGTLITEDPYQSIGVAVVLTRDLYLYPNIQFIPNDISAEKSNVAMAVYLNL